SRRLLSTMKTDVNYVESETTVNYEDRCQLFKMMSTLETDVNYVESETTVNYED
ncbi:hypothetical protein BgiBS90_034380, partial [Biomphalaria glabrata]